MGMGTICSNTNQNQNIQVQVHTQQKRQCFKNQYNESGQINSLSTGRGSNLQYSN